MNYSCGAKFAVVGTQQYSPPKGGNVGDLRLLQQIKMSQRHPTHERWTARRYSSGDIVPAATGGGLLEHDPAWLLAQCDCAEKQVLVMEADGVRLPLFVHRTGLQFRLGEKTLASVPVLCHVLTGCLPPVAKDGLLMALADCLPADGVVFLQGLGAKEPLRAALDSPAVRRWFHILPQGLAYQRRCLAVGGGMDTFLKTRNSQSRYALRKCQRDFEQAHAGRVELGVYADPEAIEDMLALIEPVSSRTYQSRLLGLGIRRDGFIANQLRVGARLGLTRCYVLKVDGRPVIWCLGYVYGDTYYGHHTGYDPEWRRWQPGIVIHLAMFEDLARSLPGVRRFDFLYGDSVFKQRLSNEAREERHYYLFPRDARGTALFHALRATDALSEGVGYWLERHGLKEKLRRWLRRG